MTLGFPCAAATAATAGAAVIADAATAIGAAAMVTIAALARMRAVLVRITSSCRGVTASMRRTTLALSRARRGRWPPGKVGVPSARLDLRLVARAVPDASAVGDVGEGGGAVHAPRVTRHDTPGNPVALRDRTDVSWDRAEGNVQSRSGLVRQPVLAHAAGDPGGDRIGGTRAPKPPAGEAPRRAVCI